MENANAFQLNKLKFLFSISNQRENELMRVYEHPTRGDFVVTATIIGVEPTIVVERRRVDEGVVHYLRRYEKTRQKFF
jgi:hypothetical protein